MRNGVGSNGSGDARIAAIVIVTLSIVFLRGGLNSAALAGIAFTCAGATSLLIWKTYPHRFFGAEDAEPIGAEETAAMRASAMPGLLPLASFGALCVGAAIGLAASLGSEVGTAFGHAAAGMALGALFGVPALAIDGLLPVSETNSEHRKASQIGLFNVATCEAARASLTAVALVTLMTQPSPWVFLALIAEAWMAVAAWALISVAQRQGTQSLEFKSWALAATIGLSMIVARGLSFQAEDGGWLAFAFVVLTSDWFMVRKPGRLEIERPSPTLMVVRRRLLERSNGIEYRDGHPVAANQEKPSVNFEGMALIGKSFAGRSLAFANFRGSDLRFCDFSNCHLEGIDLRGARLDGAVFRGSMMAYATLSGAYIGDADFRGAKLYASDVTGCDFGHAMLDHAHFRGLILDERTSWPEGTDSARFQSSRRLAYAVPMRAGGGEHLVHTA